MDPPGGVVVLLGLEKVKICALLPMDESTHLVVVVLLLVELLVLVGLSVHPGGNSPEMIHGTPELVDVGSTVVLCDESEQSVNPAGSVATQGVEQGRTTWLWRHWERSSSCCG